MFHPFFSAKDLDDEAINKKIIELQSRLVYASAYVGDADMISQLRGFIETLEMERQERLAKEVFTLWNKQFPNVIESDPEFKENVEKGSDKGRRPGSVQQGKDQRSQRQPFFAKRYAPGKAPGSDSGSDPGP